MERKDTEEEKEEEEDEGVESVDEKDCELHQQTASETPSLTRKRPKKERHTTSNAQAFSLPACSQH